MTYSAASADESCLRIALKPPESVNAQSVQRSREVFPHGTAPLLAVAANAAARASHADTTAQAPAVIDQRLPQPIGCLLRQRRYTGEPS
jgi:hypothetical protein